MKNKYPILIPIKGKSIRCPDKNRKLLPFTLNYLKFINRIENAVVITDCFELEKYAKTFGVRTYVEIREESQDELLSCYNYLKNSNIKFDFFFLLPVTHPLRTVELLSLFEEKNKSVDIDFLTSICTFTDRKNFFVQLQENGKADFLLSGLTRKGQDCEQHYMIDGSLYLIKTSFLERVIQSENTNETFWNGKFQVIINYAPFIDIDTFQDMERFKYILKVSPL